jgi:hypothetical protein
MIASAMKVPTTPTML